MSKSNPPGNSAPPGTGASSAVALRPIPIFLVAAADGKAARRRGERRDPKPYLHRYEGQNSAISPYQAWLAGWDRADDELAFEQSRPSIEGEVEWYPSKLKPPV